MSIPTQTAPAKAWKHVVWLSLLGTAGCFGLSFGLNYLLLRLRLTTLVRQHKVGDNSLTNVIKQDKGASAQDAGEML